MTPLTEWPEDDAPVTEWLRPLSAKIVNTRELSSNSRADPTDLRTRSGGLGLVMRKAQEKKRRAAARRKRRGEGA